jgi:hypothetical protein
LERSAGRTVEDKRRQFKGGFWTGIVQELRERERSPLEAGTRGLV